MVGTGRLMLTGAVTACVVLGLAQGAQARAVPQITALSWHVLNTPTPSGSVGSDLSDVSCANDGDCTAVGSYESVVGGQGVFTTFAEQWNGSSWTIQNTPEATSSDLNGVSCLSATDCVAVGDVLTGVNINTDTLAEVWNGSTWTVQPTPTPKGATRAFLIDVDCTSATNCLAVGDYSGKNGHDQFLLAERWDGTSWKLSGTQTPTGSTMNDFNGVSCGSARSCVAVGTSDSSLLAESWSGGGWTQMSIPNPSGSTGGYLGGVSCTAANSCTAAGDYFNGSVEATLAEHWDGTSWAQQTTPNETGATVNDLSDASCATASKCVVVGGMYKKKTGTTTFSEVSTGSSWAIKKVGAPAGSTESSLASVSCASASDCIAVGFWGNSSGTDFNLAAQYN